MGNPDPMQNTDAPMPKDPPSGDGKEEDKVPAEPQKKGTNVMSAASALTRLGSTSEGGDPAHDSDSNDADGAGKDADNSEKEQEDNKDKKDEEEEDNIPMSFPQRLMEILSDEDSADVISWLPHGRGFMIYHKKKFAEEVLPKYFKKTKFTSFTRKLNRWNFTRITRGPETGAYYHECFQRGNLRLCMQMCCQSAKSHKAQSQMPSNSMLGQSTQGGRLNMNNTMSMMQMNPQIALGSGVGGVDPNLLMLHQQLEKQRQELLLQQQQNQQQQQKVAALAGLKQQYPNQQKNVTPQMGNPTPVGVPGNPSLIGPASATAPPASSPLGTTDNPMYSRGVMNAAFNALERNNNTNYLSMLLAQEKVQSQMAQLGPDAMSRVDLQRQQANLLLAQQQQFDLITRQRMMQSAANTAQQQSQQQQSQNLKAPASQAPDRRAKAA